MVRTSKGKIRGRLLSVSVMSRVLWGFGNLRPASEKGHAVEDYFYGKGAVAGSGLAADVSVLGSLAGHYHEKMTRGVEECDRFLWGSALSCLIIV